MSLFTKYIYKNISLDVSIIELNICSNVFNKDKSLQRKLAGHSSSQNLANILKKTLLYTPCQIKFTDQQWYILKADNLVFGKETQTTDLKNSSHILLRQSSHPL